MLNTDVSHHDFSYPLLAGFAHLLLLKMGSLQTTSMKHHQDQRDFGYAVLRAQDKANSICICIWTIFLRSSAHKVLFWLIPILPLLDYITIWIILWRDDPSPAHHWRTIWHYTSNAFKILTPLTFHFSSLNFCLYIHDVHLNGIKLWKFIYGNRFNVC